MDPQFELHRTRVQAWFNTVTPRLSRTATVGFTDQCPNAANDNVAVIIRRTVTAAAVLFIATAVVFMAIMASL